MCGRLGGKRSAAQRSTALNQITGFPAALQHPPTLVHPSRPPGPQAKLRPSHRGVGVEKAVGGLPLLVHHLADHAVAADAQHEQAVAQRHVASILVQLAAARHQGGQVVLGGEAQRAGRVGSGALPAHRQRQHQGRAGGVAVTEEHHLQRSRAGQAGVGPAGGCSWAAGGCPQVAHGPQGCITLPGALANPHLPPLTSSYACRPDASMVSTLCPACSWSMRSAPTPSTSTWASEGKQFWGGGAGSGGAGGPGSWDAGPHRCRGAHVILPAFMTANAQEGRLSTHVINVGAVAIGYASPAVGLVQAALLRLQPPVAR